MCTDQDMINSNQILKMYQYLVDLHFFIDKDMENQYLVKNRICFKTTIMCVFKSFYITYASVLIYDF